MPIAFYFRSGDGPGDGGTAGEVRRRRRANPGVQGRPHYYYSAFQETKEWGFHVQKYGPHYRVGLFDPKADGPADDAGYTSAFIFKLADGKLTMVVVVDPAKAKEEPTEFAAPKGRSAPCVAALQAGASVLVGACRVALSGIGGAGGDELGWFWIGTHAEYDSLIGR